MLLLNCTRILKKTSFPRFLLIFLYSAMFKEYYDAIFFLGTVFFLVRRFLENLISFAMGRKPEKKHKVYVRL